MEYSVVIPLCNEQGSLGLLHERLVRVMEQVHAQYEIIYVDDDSTDASLAILKRIQESCSKVKVISLRRHAGKTAALCAGFQLSLGRWIITLDADLQINPEDIPTLLSFKEKFDLIMGVRVKRQDSFMKKFSSGVAHLFRKIILNDKTIDTGCSLRVFRKDILSSLYLFRNSHRFFGHLVRSHGFSVKEVPVSHSLRVFGKSKYATFKRFTEGVVDLFGVAWLKSRRVIYDIDEYSKSRDEA